MKKQKLSTILFSLLLLCGLSAKSQTNNLLPKPHHLEYNKSANFQLNGGVKLILPQIPPKSPDVKGQLQQLVQSGGGNISSTAAKYIEVRMVQNIPTAKFQEEAYSIAVAEKGIVIEATTLKGAYWGVQTLIQLAESGKTYIPSCKIVDWAAFRVRGYMHDVGRSFIEFNELKNEIVKLSRFKINTFHWHLTDNQGWRLESKKYPQLNAKSSYSRLAGKYYTISQAKELVAFARQHNVTIIPEIDMPGHSEAFRKAMGHVMLTNNGLAEMKNIMTEACETFADTEWMHIGSDEVRPPDRVGATMNDNLFVKEMAKHIHNLGKKIVVWNPGHGYDTSDIDMTQMWSSRGAPTTGVPAIDSRYHYINHYDQYADVVSLYNSTIAQQQQGSHQYAGAIIGIWNDRVLPTDRDIILQNAFYQSMLAVAERAWLGGGKGYFTQIGTALEPNNLEFVDWERRFLFHKYNFLKDEPIAYVKQTNVRWRITDQFPNNGDLNAKFPPENSLANSYTFNGKKYNTTVATGAAIYLRHVWGTLIPSFFSNPMANNTAYAFTYLHSDVEREVGMQLEFQNYGRSEADLPAPQGKWDYNNSRIWVNDNEIKPPVWQNRHTSKSNEITLKNENFTARKPILVTLHKGWNKVLIKLPNRGFSSSQVRLMKWMFTCVFTTTDGRKALDNVIYSPDRSMSPSLDTLLDAIDRAESFLSNAKIGEEPGNYSQATISPLTALLAKAKEIAKNGKLTDADYETAFTQLSQLLDSVKERVNLPLASDGSAEYWYKFTSVRENRSVVFKGRGRELQGERYVAGNKNFLWKLVSLSDNSYSLVTKTGEYISIANPKLKAIGGKQSANGWRFEPLFSDRKFIIVSGSSQFNQGNSGTAFAINNWGGGTNRTDDGCQYRVDLVKKVTSAVELLPADNHKFWVVNGTLQSNKPFKNISAFNIYGQELDIKNLPQGVIVVKAENVVRKLLVR